LQEKCGGNRCPVYSYEEKAIDQKKITTYNDYTETPSKVGFRAARMPTFEGVSV